jgi:hypothetical protein
LFRISTLLGLTSIFHIIACAMERKNDCIQSLGMKKKLSNLVTMEKTFNDGKKKYTTFY